MAGDWLGNLFEGLKQGYMDSGGATPANVFSGPTPMEGDAPAGFAGGLGNFAGSLGGKISDIALHTLPDLIKDPQSFLNERGELSMTRVLSPDFRREKIKEAKSAEEMDRARLAAQAIVQGHTFIQDALGFRTPEARAAALDVYGGDPRFAAAANAANAETAAGQRGAAAAGLLPEVSAVALPEDALTAGQKQLADRLAREQNVQQAELTRGTQTHQFGLSSKLDSQKHNYRLAEMSQADVNAGNQKQYEARLKEWAKENDIPRKQYDAILGAYRDQYKSQLRQSEDIGKSSRRITELAYQDQTNAAQKQYQAELNVWQDKQKQGQESNPYPVIQGLYDSGYFKDQPQMEQIAGWHLQSKSDPKNAAAFLAGVQSPGKAMPIVAGTPGATVSERNGLRSISSLRRQVNKGQIPEYLMESAKSALKARDGRLAYDILMRSNKALTPKDTDWTASAVRFIQSPDFQKMQPDRQQALTQAVAQGDTTYLNHVMPKIETGNMGMADAVMSNPQFKDASARANAAVSTLGSIGSVEKAAFTPEGTGVDQSLFSPAMAALLPKDADWLSVALNSGFDEGFANRKQNLISTSDKVVSKYILDMTGKVSNQNELNRMRNVAPTGNEASARLFQTKLNAFNAAVKREAEIAKREAEAIGNSVETGNWRGVLPSGLEVGLRAERDESIRQLNKDLEAAELDPEMQPDGPLTDAEKAELEKYRGNR